MSDMMSYISTGWVKIMRSIINSRSYDNPNATAAYTHCLMRANYKAGTVKGIFLQRGQFLTSIEQFAAECGMSEKQMRTALDMLEADGLIARELAPSRANNRANNSKRNGTIITVENYDVSIDSVDAFGVEQGEYMGEKSGEKPGEELGNSIRIKNKEKEYLTDSKESVCRTKDVRRVQEAWNALGLSQISSLASTSKRVQMLKARINQNGVDKVVEAVERIRKSSFLQGQSKRGWTITFDWFVKPNNFTKVLEGQYDDRENAEMDHEQRKGTIDFTKIMGVDE